MLGFHSIRALGRARCGIPQWLISFQPCALGAKRLRWLPASAWVRRHFSQRVPCPLVNTSGLCQNNDNARRLPTGPAVNMPPWLRHTQRVVSVCGPDIIANTGLSSTSAQSTAAHQFCLTGLTCLTSLTGPTNAPHQTLRQNQTAFQYWGYRSYVKLRVISRARRCRGKEALSASLPQAPSLAAGAAHRYGARGILF